MDSHAQRREMIKYILTEYAAHPFSNSPTRLQTVFDTEKDHYLVVFYGLEGKRWVYNTLIHVELTDNKFIILKDGTEYSIAQELFDRGVPDEDMVQAFRPYLQAYKRLEAEWESEQQLAGVR